MSRVLGIVTAVIDLPISLTVLFAQRVQREVIADAGHVAFVPPGRRSVAGR
jgi:hypothetical protein